MRIGRSPDGQNCGRDMSENNLKHDYAAPAISELSPRRFSDQQVAGDHTTRTVGRRLLSACILVPAALWLMLISGVRYNYYDLATCSLVFVCSVTAVLGAIVWFNVAKLSRLDAQRAQTEEQLKLAKE